MVSSHHFWLLVLPCLTGLHLSTQEELCIPAGVENLALTESILSWKNADREECEISYYLVYVRTSNGSHAWEYTVTEKSLDVGYIGPCERYSFRVQQITVTNHTSIFKSISVSTPPGPDANLHLDYVSASQTGRTVRLQWSLEDNSVKCALHYRIVAYNEDNDHARDIYTALTNAVVSNIVPCARYTFSVRGVFSVQDEGPATLVRHTANPVVADAPKLGNVTLSDTSATFSWLIEEYNKNRCPINGLILDASPYFNVTYTIRDQVNRTPLPLRLTGLTPDTLYYLKVTANNTAGPSEAFHLAVQTLPSS